MKKSLALLMSALMLLGMTACGSTPAQSQSSGSASGSGKKGEVLTVGLSGDFPPFEFYAQTDGGRALVGADVKLAEHIADELGMELELVDMAFDGLLGSLNEGKIDLVISGMSVDPARKCLYSDPYFEAGQALLVPAGNEKVFASLEELMGHKIGGQMGSLQQELAETYAGKDSAQIVNNVQDMIMMVSEGKLEGMFCETVVAQSAIQKSDKVAIAELEVPSDRNLVAVCMKEGNTEMADKINPIIAEVVEQNLYGDWMTQYLSVEEVPQA